MSESTEEAQEEPIVEEPIEGINEPSDPPPKKEKDTSKLKVFKEDKTIKPDKEKPKKIEKIKDVINENISPN